MTRILVTIGISLILIGLAWPLIQKSGLGRLPGDIIIEKENFRVYIPITSAILISVFASVIFWLFRR